MNAPIPLPLLLTTSSLSLETQLYEIITESSKACAAFLRHSLRRATSLGWTATGEGFETTTTTAASGAMYNEH